MGTMKERSEHILEVAVAEFIASGHPITSESLFEEFEFGIKPAMIRWELNALADGGFLYQRHPSGGRFPTDKAYRFFVEHLMERDLEDMRAARDLAEEYARRGIKRLVNELSDFLGLLGVGYDVRGREVHESGLHVLLQSIEADRKEDFVKIADDVELLPERIERYRTRNSTHSEEPRVFIGASPLTKSEHLSVIISSLDGENGPCMLLAVGPKRMDYQKSIRLMRSLAKCFQNS